MFKRILVPLDGSGQAKRALPITARPARVSGGFILLVCVVSTKPASLPSGRPSYCSFKLLERPTGPSLRAIWQGWLGLVSPSILAVTADQYGDIIIMCSHGSTGVTGWWTPSSVIAKPDETTRRALVATQCYCCRGVVGRR